MFSLVNDGSASASGEGSNNFDRFRLAMYKRYRLYIDKSAPHTLQRWVGFGALFVIFLLRVFLADAYYIILYGLAIYLLNCFIAFLTPQSDPESEYDGLPSLPTRRDDEFRPFIRRLSEFKFWHQASKAVVVALFISLLGIDIEVYTPVLVFYFIVLFATTMKRQIQHMWKHKYIPMNFGKKVFNGGRNAFGGLGEVKAPAKAAGL